LREVLLRVRKKYPKTEVYIQLVDEKLPVAKMVSPPLNDRQKIKGQIDLAARGITPEQAADMRNRVISFEDDWNAPGMEVYDEL
jgi:hypothetical protein